MWGDAFTNNKTSWYMVQNACVFCELIQYAKTAWRNHMECVKQHWARCLLGYMVVKLQFLVESQQIHNVMGSSKMKCHGEMGMFYLGELMGIHKDETQRIRQATSNAIMILYYMHELNNLEVRCPRKELYRDIQRSPLRFPISNINKYYTWSLKENQSCQC